MRARWAIAAGAAAGVAHAFPGTAVVVPALREAMGVRAATRSGAGLALTFDDGPDPDGTPAILELLAARGARGTFFLVGEQVARAPALAAEIVAAGHEVGLHCDRHRHLLRLAPWQVAAELRRAEERIVAATGRPIELYRPPYGVFSAAALALVRRRGWRPLLWSAWGREWVAGAEPAAIEARLRRGMRPGGVLLLHDSDRYSSAGTWRRTAAVLPRLLDEAERRGLDAISA